jgi:hypothetical protein
MVSIPDAPRATVTVACDALRAKSPLAVTINVAFVECVKDAVWPVIVSMYVPGGVFAAVVTVSVDEPDPAMDDVGANAGVAPAGNPLTDRFTVSTNPFNALTEIVYETFPPWIVEREEGEAVIEKSGAGLTVIFRVGGFGSVRFALSVTVSVAVYVPAAEYVTLPGVASALLFGLPPGNVHEYAEIVPSGSLPDPANDTDWPAAIVTSVVGLLIVPFGGMFAGAEFNWTNCATEGTPALFNKKSM